METCKVYVFEHKCVSCDNFCLTCFDGCAEFGVHLARGNFGLRVGVDARGEAQKDLLTDALACGIRLDGVKLLPVIDDEIADSAVDGEGDIRVGLVVAVEERVFERKARTE